MIRNRRWTLARRSAALAFFGLLLAAAHADLPWLVGSNTASRLLDAVPFVDPLAFLEALLAGGVATGTMWIGAGVLVGLAALCGPIFCGWLCPLGLVLDLNDSLRRVVLRRRDVAPTRIPRGLKLGLLGALLGFALVAGAPVFAVVSPINLLGRGLLFAAGTGLAALVVLGVAEWLLPRVWCRSLCPLGALYGLLGRFAFLRVRIDPEEAGRAPCRRCTIHCPMGIAVMEDHTLAGKRSIDDADCTRCGACLEVCPRGVLSLGLPRRSRNRS